MREDAGIAQAVAHQRVTVYGTRRVQDQVFIAESHGHTWAIGCRRDRQRTEVSEIFVEAGRGIGGEATTRISGIADFSPRT